MDADVLLATADACLLAPFDLESRKLDSIYGVLAGRIMKNPLGKFFAYDYAITGTWSDPKVEKLKAIQLAPLPGTLDESGLLNR